MADPKLPLTIEALQKMSIEALEALQQDLGRLMDRVRGERRKVVATLELKRAALKRKA